jgi:hypothetical protein
MLPLTRIQFLSFAAAGVLVALTAATSARPDELAQNLGPVGPHEPILTTVGGKRVIAFYVPDVGNCVVNSVVWDITDANADSVARVRISLNPGQMMHIDSGAEKSLNLKCGDNAATLSIVGTSELILAGVAG